MLLVNCVRFNVNVFVFDLNNVYLMFYYFFIGKFILKIVRLLYCKGKRDKLIVDLILLYFFVFFE